MLTNEWRKSSRSGHNGACVEARLDALGTEIRDSKDLTGPTLKASTVGFMGFLNHVKAVGYNR